MRKRTLIFLILALSLAGGAHAASEPHWGIVMHGGAGNLAPDAYTREELRQMQAVLRQALAAGHRVLASGGASLDAVQAAIVVLEDSPWFNAGKGAVFTHDGRNELDASIMDGARMTAGAVTGVTRIRNPILLARLVMDRSPHVLLAGEGAEAFAVEQGVTLVDPKYFHTERRWRQLQEELAKERKHSLAAQRHFGTVGAVALDMHGHLAAGTSTGGLTDKRHGRIGDSPIIGAGTYASDASCAVSATGHGEFFIRYTVAHDICARVQYLKMSVDAAAKSVVQDELVKAGGEGGVIAMDPQGHVAMEFNTNTMFRGYMGADGKAKTAVFADARESQ